MKFETIIYEQHGPVAVIRFNRPHRLNAVVEQLYQETLDALRLAEKNPSARVIVLTGEGRAFCVGADLKEHANDTRTAYERREYLKLGQSVCGLIQRIPKVVVAAVNGYAVGAGAEMAISSDFLLMAESAELGLPEIRLATFVGGGVTKRLPQLVGLAKAREMIFLGERIRGAEAQRIGLAHSVLPDAEFRGRAMEFAERVARGAPISMALAKEQLNTSSGRDLDAVLIAELEGVSFCTTTSDWREGVMSFAEKRIPQYKGV
ncbi:MAG: enoyl-CoA hydratase/isomerase family protein [Lautropia sp.]